jgi:hypothetical protein
MSKKKKAKQKRIGEKIALLRREGKGEKEAAGEAYGMERSGRLRGGGKYIHKKSKRGRRKSRRA